MFPHGPPWPLQNAAPPRFPYLPPPPPAAIGRFGRPLRPPVPAGVQVQSVTAVNFGAELDMIGSLLPSYPYIVVDTEYPGTVHRPPAGQRDGDLTSDQRYALVKANVDELPMVQLGLTLCDAQGNLPVVLVDCNSGYPVPMERAWEINFSDFDIHRDRHVAQSVEFLRSQGIDFDRVRACGVSSAAFKDKLVEVLAAAAAHGEELTWVAFGGAYDLAYLVKMLSNGQPLPETRQQFMDLVKDLLGGRVFDAKYMAENCGRADLRGVGLRTVAANLGMPMPVVDTSFLAGPKSVTACRIHMIMRMHVLSQEGVSACQGIIDGLH